MDQILVAWQQATGRVKTFQADFIRYEYDLVFGRPDQPTTVEKGQVAFAAPDRGLFSVDGPQPEKWLCDGKSLFVYDFKAKLLTEHKLPPALQGPCDSRYSADSHFFWIDDRSFSACGALRGFLALRPGN